MDGIIEFVENQENYATYNNSIFAVIKRKISESLKEYSYQNFKHLVNIICHLFFRIFYFCYGILQFFATWAGLVKVSHYDNIITLLVSLGLGFFPFIGTFSGIWGAQTAWGWSLPYSLFIFITPYFVANGPLLLIAFFDIYKDSKYLKMSEKQNTVIL